jgi:hypothetical protein
MRQRNRTPGDGDCFFHSYLKATEKNWDVWSKKERRERARQLRTALIEYATNHWDTLPLTTNETKNDYIKRMQKGCSNTDTWATEFEIDTMARMQKRRISIMSDGKGGNEKGISTFPVGMNETTFSPNLPEVAIKYVGGNHFDTDQDPIPASNRRTTTQTSNRRTTTQTSKPAQSTTQTSKPVQSTAATGKPAQSTAATGNRKSNSKKRTYWGSDLAIEELQTVGVFAFLGVAVLSVASAGAAMMRV